MAASICKISTFVGMTMSKKILVYRCNTKEKCSVYYSTPDTHCSVNIIIDVSMFTCPSVRPLIYLFSIMPNIVTLSPLCSLRALKWQRINKFIHSQATVTPPAPVTSPASIKSSPRKTPAIVTPQPL